MILCDTSPLWELAGQLGLCVAGEVRATSTEIHANDSDGSSEEEGEASLERGEEHANSRKGECRCDRQELPWEMLVCAAMQRTSSCEMPAPEGFRCCARVVRCSFERS